MRVQVNLSDNMVSRIDKIADEMGLTRSALCSTFIGQSVMSFEKTFTVLQDTFNKIGDETVQKK